jgi:meso-butanediol dehydrogenase / (S,S)-butanediol dehydrogenase / diacetyl reductase
MAEFEGKVALVTGTTGIARAVTLRLADAGARVLACGIDAEGNAALHGARPGIVARQTDVSDADAVRAAVGAAVAQFGGLDLIVNAAAVHPFGTLVDTDLRTWERCLAVNVGSIYLTAHFGVPEVRKRGGGAIVNFASVQGHACQRNVAAYAASKGAIHALTRAMALDHAADNIRVNSVSPGSVRTPMLEMAARAFDGPDADIEDVIRRFGAAHPLGRVATAEEVAEMAAFLLGPRGSFCTGGDFRVDGGLTAGIGVA